MQANLARLRKMLLDRPDNSSICDQSLNEDRSEVSFSFSTLNTKTRKNLLNSNNYSY